MSPRPSTRLPAGDVAGTARPRLADPIETLGLVGKARAASLREAGITTVYDLLSHAPLRHEDRRRFTAVKDLRPEGPALLLLSVVSARLIRTRRRDFTITECYLKDGTGTVKALWFNRPYLVKGLAAERRLVVYGEGAEKGAGITLENPEYEILEDGDEDAGSPHFGRVVPVYRRLRTLSPRGVRKLLLEVLDTVVPRLWLPSWDRDDLPGKLRALHFPETPEQASAARAELAFREVVELQMGLGLARRRRAARPRSPVVPGDPAREAARLAELAPFPLTGAQGAALEAILGDLAGAVPMARLLHGEVGAGKTIVALLSALPALRAGRQVALLSPTEVLARQLHDEARGLLARAGLGPPPELLVAARRPAERNHVLLALARGDVGMVVGTHALVKDRVSFRDLAYVIVDEQHRFGVLERQALSGKSSPGGPADLLVMSATPIPRTLTLTLFGDLDVTRIAELPPGRQPVATRVLAHHERRIAYEALAAAVGRREQGFVVVPRIEADAARARSSLDAIARSLREKQRGWRVAVLHGALDGDHKELVARRLRSGDVDVVVATTVVEVGVDVPRATVMVVLEADRFGLAQLHQLRGRVGRSSLSASCHLVLSPEAGPAAAERLRVLETVSDGFQVAEVDWRERGPGDMTGARQWGGAGLRLAGVAELQAQIDAAREAATRRLQAIDGDEAEAFLRGWEERLRMVQVA